MRREGTGAEAMSETSDGARILEVESVSKNYGAVRALHDVSLVLNAGEVTGLVGDNGAGKSTLVKIIAGAVKPESGRVLLDGSALELGNARSIRDAGIETIFQELALISSLSIVDNIFLNRERFSLGSLGRTLRLLDTRRMRRETTEGLARMELRLPPPTTKVGVLSGGQRQTVAIARAILWGQRVVLMDEPVAALGVRQTQFVLSFVDRLKRQNVAVLFISHNMEHVFHVAERIVVLRLGRKVFDGPRKSVTAQDLVALMTGLRSERPDLG